MSVSTCLGTLFEFLVLAIDSPPSNPIKGIMHIHISKFMVYQVVIP